MSPQISVYDNSVVAYEVLAKEKKIVLHTECRDRESHEFTDIVFEEGLSYDFENDLFGTIIFDVKEVDLPALLKENVAMFEDGWHYGWSRGWERDKKDIDVFVRRLKMRAFELSSTYGMSGWVLARRMSKVQKGNNQPDQPAERVLGGVPPTSYSIRYAKYTRPIQRHRLALLSPTTKPRTSSDLVVPAFFNLSYF